MIILKLLILKRLAIGMERANSKKVLEANSLHKTRTRAVQHICLPTPRMHKSNATIILIFLN